MLGKPLCLALLLLAAPVWAEECPPSEEWVSQNNQIEILHVQLRLTAPFLCDLLLDVPDDLEAPPLVTLARKPGPMAWPKPITIVDRDILFIPRGWHDNDGFLRITLGDAKDGRTQFYHIKIYTRRVP